MATEKQNVRFYDDCYEILRTAVDETLNYIQSTSDNESRKSEWMKKLAGKLAGIFLGSDSKFDRDPDWNKPGKIDEFVHTYFPFATENPKERMVMFFMVFLKNVFEIVNVASRPEVLEEQWQSAMSNLYRETASVLIGIPIDVDLEESVASDVKESVALSGRQRAMLDRWKDYP